MVTTRKHYKITPNQQYLEEKIDDKNISSIQKRQEREKKKKQRDK